MAVALVVADSEDTRYTGVAAEELESPAAVGNLDSQFAVAVWTVRHTLWAAM